MINLGIVGVGKIVLDQHWPAIQKNTDLKLIATASRNGAIDGVPAYLSVEEMVAATPELDAVAMCMPPQFRFSPTKFALENGLHTLLEKPPGATVSEVDHLIQTASSQNRTLFTTWHSRHAAAVQKMKSCIAGKSIDSVHVAWKENVRRWHPGQDWIWQAGGLGVFDTGINGLSVVTEILSENVFLVSSRLSFPENKAAPIAAEIMLATPSQLEIKLDFDWRVTDDEEWTVAVKAEGDDYVLTAGGAELYINGTQSEVGDQNEYESIYSRFVCLIQDSKSDIDVGPLKLVSDAFMLGERRTVGCLRGRVNQAAGRS